MSKIFISYPRQNSRPAAASIHEPLARHFEEKFGPGAVFMDVHGIPRGVSPRTYLNEQVAATELLLAVIADRWLTEADGHGRRPIDNPDEPVRIEIEAALRRGIPIVPVHAGGTESIFEAGLPDSMKGLARYGGYTLGANGAQFAAGVAQLIAALDSYFNEVSRLKRTAAAPAAGGNFADRLVPETGLAGHAAEEGAEVPLDALARSQAEAFFEDRDRANEGLGESDVRAADEQKLSQMTLASFAGAQDAQPAQDQSSHPWQAPAAQAPEDYGSAAARAGAAGRTITISEIASCIDPELVLALWHRLELGDTAALQPHGLYSKQDMAFIELVQRRCQADPAFSAAIGRYLGDSGKVLQEMNGSDPSGRSAQFWLASDNGRAYFVLSHITGRFGPQRAPE
jgi:hypothetical protein